MKNLYLLLILLGTTFFAKAQGIGQNYFKAKTGVALEDMSSDATTIFRTNADGIFSGATAFFPFSFAGNSYNTFAVSEDGVVVLGNALYAPYPYDNYFTQTPALLGQSAAYPILLPWGEDLFTGSNGSVSYKITGTAPARKLIIEYKVNSAEDNTSYYNKTFQVWLFEGSSQIQFVYGSVAADWYNQANIGIAASVNDYLSVDGSTNTVSATTQFSNSGSYPGRAPVPVKGTSYIFSPSAIVDVVLPPPPPPVSTPVINPVTATVSISPAYCVAGQNKYTIYLGYGLQSVTLYASASGGNPSASGYKYSWSPATGLSNAAVSSPIANPQVTTTYSVTISDGNGNSTTQQVTVYVVDARCNAKTNENIRVCKYAGGGYKEVCIATRDVDDNLKRGAILGGCNVSTASAVTTSTNAVNRLTTETSAVSFGNATIYPSPSTGVFTIRLPETARQTTITIYDISGRVVAKKVTGEDQQLIQFDLTHKAHGMYLVKMISNDGIRTSKINIQ